MENVHTSTDQIQAVLAAQKALYHRLFRMQTREWIHLELSMGQLKTLVVLASARSMTIGTLAETLETSKSNASILVDRLVQLGLVERTEDAEDRRRMLVTLTAAGSDLVTRLRQGPGERIAYWLKQLDPEDLTALERGMQALAGVAERDTVHPPATSH